jgi:hypothetical protein
MLYVNIGTFIVLITAKVAFGAGVAQSVVSDYRLDNQGSIHNRGKSFSFSLCVQTSSEAHPASYPIGTMGTFPGCKAQLERDADHSPHLVPRSRMSRSYTSYPPCHLHGK